MTRQEKRSIRLDICRMLDFHCANCPKKKAATKGLKSGEWDKAVNEFRIYCTEECSIGKQIHSRGRQLIAG